jgi:hypothetical protein
VQFDIYATGNKVSTGWVGNGDGLLVMDRNGNGTIDDGSELFGSSVTLADGSKATDGYQALSALDTNGDGVIDSKDTAFSKLEVWVDSNGDGISEAGELTTLSQRGITSLSLKDTATSANNNGNWVGLTSNFTTSDGATHDMADVWFSTGAAKTATDLSSKVSGLSQSIAAFDTASITVTPAATTKLDVTGSTQPTGNLAVASKLAGAISEYAASAPGSNQLAATSDTLKPSNWTSHSNGYLVSKA